MNQLKLVSLFAGSGGLDLGFESSGFNIPLAIDGNQAAIETYNKNRSPTETTGRVADLSRIDPQLLISWWIGNAGLDAKPLGIIGGPPCQSFSVANVHKSLEDPRAKLPLDYARILKAFDDEFDLDFFLFENVAGLAHRQHEDSMSELLSLFESTGFDVRVLILDAVEFNVPQYRKRLFILGVKASRFDLTNFQIPASCSRRKTVRQTIGGLSKPRFFSRNDRPDEADVHANHWCMNPRSPKFKHGYLLAGSTKGRSFRVLDWDLPSRTVSYGHREVHVHPTGTRRLSVYEAMLLQGFPPSYRLYGTLSEQIQMVSDAVPPPLAHALASSIKNYLSSSRCAKPREHSAANGHNSHLGTLGEHTIEPKSTRA